MKGFQTALIFVIGLGAIASTLAVFSNVRDTEKPAQVEQQHQEQKATGEVHGAREDMLAAIRVAIDAGEFASAEREIQRLQESTPDDATLNELLNSAKEQRLSQEVRAIPAADFYRNINFYTQLVAIAPENPSYKERLDHYTQRKEEAQAAAVQSFRRTRDELEKITWYRSPNVPQCVNCGTGLYFYISQKDGGPAWLRFVLQYNADDWLFVNSATVYVGEASFPVTGAFERDSSSGIWEWLDRLATSSDLDLLQAISDADIVGAKTVTIRFHGRQYQRDVEMPTSHTEAIRQTLIAFVALTENFVARKER